MTETLPLSAETYILENQHKGFDELARYLRGAFIAYADKTEEEVKDIIKDFWNSRNLGWKQFPRTLVNVRPIGGGQWELVEDLIMYPCEGFPVIAEKGFVFDFASVPRFAWWFLSPSDDGIRLPALLHDLLYSIELFPRGAVDHIFIDGMKNRRLSLFKRTIAFLAVRVGGGSTWRRHNQGEVRDKRRQMLEKMAEYRARTFSQQS